MLVSRQVEVDQNATLLFDAQARTRVTIRASGSSGVKIGDKEVTPSTGLSLTANVSRDVELQKGDALYAITTNGTRVVELLIQAEN